MSKPKTILCKIYKNWTEKVGVSMSNILTVYQFMKPDVLYSINFLSDDLSMKTAEIQRSITYLLKGGLIDKRAGEVGLFKTKQK